ncbi:hypothetical protein APHWI1_1516 [Anaplasma phagocytophilum str. ApWI1]|uniref:Uncharacterized protein n=3 Tax=Anaplasma phagocytophilum TaxID=948 RepID=Q2GKM6_ANAPZ|nr:hypothetical protein APH_0475 [Anaplasma phagocytophilum str. HZ]AGR79335.1 hypothetical protein YYU_02325 [Anaplasma phagocytophilum str. HZ2]AGR80581.1 hypothetical protein WSQ_02320 [Anaplasma phagocytophilum str. JM]AGR81842.1 hypothetical protein YYY_02355 [Anaplasma phagocytophilum str. Dog2]EOA60834.1 hypothetical protein HGE1_02192 [Anaplasma phagocytophilum str. HGE1]KJV60763.1 hypothetical protein APHWEB_0002 [Anaplasma phagocytophilum str. Webster]KJV66238.1 hypothetical protein
MSYGGDIGCIAFEKMCMRWYVVVSGVFSGGDRRMLAPV